jgi:hypothetical protein
VHHPGFESWVDGTPQGILPLSYKLICSTHRYDQQQKHGIPSASLQYIYILLTFIHHYGLFV